jgi:uncharacterized protein (DUF4415 family)
MKNEGNIRTYTAAELKARRAESRTNWEQVDALTEEGLERQIATDKDESMLQPDWTQARLVLPEARQSVHLRLDREVVEFFRAQGKGHISRMQAVLKAYMEAHRQDGGIR